LSQGIKHGIQAEGSLIAESSFAHWQKCFFYEIHTACLCYLFIFFNLREIIGCHGISCMPDAFKNNTFLICTNFF
jgi:hypothetical protein